MSHVASLLSIEELSSRDVRALLKLAVDLRARPAPGAPSSSFVAFLWDRESVRTRLAIHQAARLLGSASVDLDLATAFYADPSRRRDHASFVRAELASMRELGCSAAIIRMHRHAILREWRELTATPIINACSDEEHPLQALADALTLVDCFGETRGLRLTLVGNGASPVFRSLLFLSARLGIDVMLACPPGYQFPDDLVVRAGSVPAHVHTHDLAAGLDRADVVCSDSVVYRALTEAEEVAFAPYRLSVEVVQRHAAEAHIMHCLPHADEIESDVVFKATSLVMQEVAARVPVTAAAIMWLNSSTRGGGSA